MLSVQGYCMFVNNMVWFHKSFITLTVVILSLLELLRGDFRSV